MDAEYKMILVGDSNAGKTSLFRKISKNVFNEKMVSTIGIDKTTLEYEINIKENEKEVKKIFKYYYLIQQDKKDIYLVQNHIIKEQMELYYYIV